MKIDASCEIWSVSRKSRLASTHEDGKNVSSKKLQIKTNLDNVTDNNFEVLKQVLNEVCFKYYYSFRYSKANFELQ